MLLRDYKDMRIFLDFRHYVQYRENEVLTEKNWNEKSSLTRNAYYYSKTMAEKEAWRIVEEQKPNFDLVVINPFLVIGPSISPGLNTSNELFVDILSGKYPGIMSLTWGIVDVRDVALAHILAMENPESSGRYLCANTTISMKKFVEFLRKEGYDNFKLPKLSMDSSIGNLIVLLSSYLQPKGVGDYLRTHIGKTPNFDNNKIRRELGLEFIPLEDSIRVTIDFLLALVAAILSLAVEVTTNFGWLPADYHKILILLLT